MSREQFYNFIPDNLILQMLDESTRLKEFISSAKVKESALWRAVHEKLLIDWTYNSNAIEGSSLTFGETLFFLQHGLTVEGKPLKDFLDARNHADAIEFLYDVIKNRRDITPGLLKEFNALLLTGVKFTPAIDSSGNKIDKPANPGEYKKYPNHVLQPDGTIHRYTEPVHVASEVEALCDYIKSASAKKHPLILASVAHYNFVRIHPFDDGNGRGARLLMNLVLMKGGYPPVIFKNEKRRIYLEALAEGDRGNLNPFVTFCNDSCLETLKSIQSELEAR